MKKVSWSDVCARIEEHVKTHPYAVFDDNPVRAVVVFNPEKSDWKRKKYSLKSRSYLISSVDKYWHHECLGNSLYAKCLDTESSDSLGIRLDWYLGEWVIDYCYFCDVNGKEVE